MYTISFIFFFFYFYLRVAQKREAAVNMEMMKKLAEDKKMNKKEKDERFVKNFIFSSSFKY